MDREKEGYWTPLEKQFRDYLLTPITWPFRFVPQAPNIVTTLGFFVLLYAMWDFFATHDLGRQIWLLAFAWITDFFDGPIARNNHMITALGTALDHARDYCIMFWMIALSFLIAVNTGEIWLLGPLLTLTVLGLAGVMAGTFLYQREKRKENTELTFGAFIREFLLHELVTTVTARIHTTVLAVGGVLYIAGAVWGSVYTIAGILFLLLQLFLLGFYIHEIWEVRYEDQAMKIRAMLQRKIEDLEKRLEPKKKVK